MSSHCVLRGNTWWCYLSPPKCVTQPSNSQLQTHRLLMMSHTSGERGTGQQPWIIFLPVMWQEVFVFLCFLLLCAELRELRRPSWWQQAKQRQQREEDMKWENWDVPSVFVCITLVFLTQFTAIGGSSSLQWNSSHERLRPEERNGCVSSAAVSHHR